MFDGGLFWGLRIAIGFSVFVIAEYLLLGATPFQNIGTSLHVVIAIFFSGGVTAGAIVGALDGSLERALARLPLASSLHL